MENYNSTQRWIGRRIWWENGRYKRKSKTKPIFVMVMDDWNAVVDEGEDAKVVGRMMD